MNQFNQQQENRTVNPSVPPQLNHGAHEVLDVHELLSAAQNAMNQYRVLEQQCTCQELRDIIHRQYRFMAQEYNTLLECLTTGKDPSMPTAQYKMQQGNNVEYGLKPGQPKKPIQSPAEFNNEHISAQMMTLMKTSAADKARAACEVTNPVVRRVIADSVPNCCEMAYEIFLYQNKKGYYQVPQFPANVMQTMIASYAPATPSGNTAPPNPQGPVQ
ncbi:spore coat protein [Thermoactinomyces mirandus]|uniref:spore coat protein n=1 Tax=Thermoactinomyces mirandus TaxID=2756294 RepID=UPI0028ABBAFF|nr:spore coat protein [Thermoactinomyces mirandus]